MIKLAVWMQLFIRWHIGHIVVSHAITAPKALLRKFQMISIMTDMISKNEKTTLYMETNEYSIKTISSCG